MRRDHTRRIVRFEPFAMAISHILNPAVLFSVGVRRRLTGWLAWVVTPLAVALAVYVIVAATAIIMAPWALVAVFLTGIMAIAFLTVGATPRSNPDWPTILDYTLSIASVATGIYFLFKSAEVVNRIALLSPLSEWDLFFGVLTVLLTLEITRRTTGLGLTVVVLIFIAYNFYGHLLGGVLQHEKIDWIHFIDIMVYTTDGIMGLPARVAATYAFMFVLFGVVLYSAKGADFFFDFAAAIAGRRPGGPAKVAVISSGLYGMISGSPTADVVTTGSVTIPVMTRCGYKPAVAAAIEVAASTGGSIMPPVMGSAAFIMAEYTGIEYRDIAVAAVLPAILYYVCVYAQVHFRAIRLGMLELDPKMIPTLLATMKKGGMFFVPLVVLVTALLYGFTPTMVGGLRRRRGDRGLLAAAAHTTRACRIVARARRYDLSNSARRRRHRRRRPGDRRPHHDWPRGQVCSRDLRDNQCPPVHDIGDWCHADGRPWAWNADAFGLHPGGGADGSADGATAH